MLIETLNPTAEESPPLAPVRNYDDAATALRALDRDPLGMATNARYLDGDHWQGKEAWGGPPVPVGIEGYVETLLVLERDQAPIPVSEEVVEHYVSGVLGNEPAFTVELKRELQDGEEPSVQETEDIGSLNDALTAFFDNSGAMEALQQFAENLCSGRGVLRPLIPPAIVERAIEFNSIIEAAGKFHLQAPEWTAAGVLTNARSREQTGIYLYKEKQPGAPDGTSTPRAEVFTVMENGRTLFQVLQGQTVVTSHDYNCGGHLLLFQADLRKPILGRAQRELQRKIDFLNYILPKNAQYAGFRERHFLGVDQPKDEKGALKNPELGPGKVGFWQPSFVEVDGEKKALPASLILTEPVDSGPIREDIQHLLEVLLKSRHLLHTVMAGDSTASAISRIQSRAQFTRALLLLKAKIERVLRDLFQTVLCLSCEFAGEEQLLQRLLRDYRISVDLRPDAGPMTPEERAAVIGMYDANLIDRETAQTMLGIEDIGSVANALSRDEETNLDVQIKRAQLFNEYSQAFDVLDAALLAGLSETVVAKIQEVSTRNDNSNNAGNAPVGGNA